MDKAVIFVLRQMNGWKVVVGDQRLGSYSGAEDAVWSAITLALHLRGEGVSAELRMHDESGVRQIWPPELPAGVTTQSKNFPKELDMQMERVLAGE